MMINTSSWSSCSRQSPWSPWSYNHFYRAECITISGFFSPSPKSYLFCEIITVDERVWENSKQKYPVGVSGLQEGGVTYLNHEILFHAYNDRTGGLVDWHRLCILSLSLLRWSHQFFLFAATCVVYCAQVDLSPCPPLCSVHSTPFF